VLGRTPASEDGDAQPAHGCGVVVVEVVVVVVGALK
jgi:hypothetical protein